MIWKPHATVAAVLEKDGRFLLVEERIGGEVRLNQPAGHLEEGESLMEAAVRETIEEAGLVFRPTHLVGLYQWRAPETGATYLRAAFGGEVERVIEDAVLDTGILGPVWLSPEEALARAAQHRSPLVMACIEDHLAGKRHPLDLIRHFPS
ncbi:MAG TPA: NUDIX hydrolase [Chromatiales bacterium]|nr:NUDIX hydrolase [Chromatiales bacterium]